MGLEKLRSHFAGLEDRFVLIGGAACYLSMQAAGSDFRATKDLDIVLCMEALDRAFVQRFWEFVRLAGYRNQEKSTGAKQFYRFNKPTSEGYPFMLELYSRVPDDVLLGEDSHLTPIPMDEQISSLSAILLDKEYYPFIQQGKRLSDGLAYIGPEHLIPLKARAWLDMAQRQKDGIHVDSREISKHRKDVFRLLAIVDPDKSFGLLSGSIRSDLARFAQSMRQEQLDPKALGYPRLSKDELIAELEKAYGLV
jgi:hypothetical protein